MPDKNIVDDYYSNISESSEKSETKPVVKAKRKLVVKTPKTTVAQKAPAKKTPAKKTDTSVKVNKKVE
mgnify:CR=1 FL=1